MITVVSLKEFQTLMKDKQITRSENTEFINNNELRAVIAEQIFDLTGGVTRGGFITVLYGVENDIDKSILESQSNEILLRLPRPKEPVYLNLPDDLPCVKIDSNTLLSSIQLDLSDSQLKSMVQGMFVSDLELGKDYSYAFLNCIKLSSVKGVLYEAELEEKIQSISDEAKYLDLVFTKTDLFRKKD